MNAYSPARINRFTAPNATALALVLATTAMFPAVVFAGDTAVTGAPGANGLPGKNGGAGKGAQVDTISSDLANTATATAGKAGNGGVSTATAPVGNGGNGGEAKSKLTLQGQIYPPNESSVEVTGTVTAVGGEGGDGGLGPVLGKGGTGGRANVKGLDYGGIDFEFAPEIHDSITVNGVGGNGGAGRDGGAGGGSSASNVSFTDLLSTLTTTSRGGNGGNALNQGGNGGNAAAATASESQYRDVLGSSALAIGGKGGDSATGLNGSGGRATATVKGSAYGVRGASADIKFTAQAIGGDSGIGTASSQPSGNGGDAFATVTSFSHPSRDTPSIVTTATAQGGNGISRGGNAVAAASNGADQDGSAASTATGGKGQIAGAAIATSAVDNHALSAAVVATANYGGSFARQVVTTATIAADPEDVSENHQTLYAQSRVGDTAGLVAATPQPAGSKYLAVKAAAPTSQEATQFLAGNTNLQTTFASGSVWGLGEFKTGRLSGGGSATASYVFDASGIGASQDLWLGLLDATIPPGSADNSFSFSVASGGTTFFQHQFTTADFLTYFDDNPIDLGSSWQDLVGSDGLFKLDVAFAGITSGLDFVFGDAASAQSLNTTSSNSVPEPSGWVLALTGFAGLLLSRRQQRRNVRA